MSKNTQLGNLVNGIYVDSTGKVGIGTTTPRAKIDVSGDVYTSSSFWAGDNNGLFIGNLTSGASYVYITGVGSTGASSYLSFSTNAGEKMRINNAGNVGIGTTSPSLNLSVQGLYGLPSTSGAQGTGIFRVQDSSSNISLDMGVIQYFGSWIQSINKSNSANLTLALNPNGGNVGIGTNSPSHNLSVKGSSATDMISWTDAINNTGYLGIRGGGVVWMNADNNLVFATSNTERMRILSNGNVGIGNTTPSTRLHVTGTISSSDLLLAGTADYSYTTSDSWTSWQTIVPTGALTAQAVYIIRIWYGTDNAPWTVATSFLFSPANTNGASADGQFAPMISTHQGGTGVIYVRARATWGSVAGLDAYFSGFAKNTGSLSIKVVRLM